MGDLFVKMVSRGDIIGLGRVGIGLAVVSLSAEVATTLAHVAIDAIGQTRQSMLSTIQANRMAATDKNQSN